MLKSFAAGHLFGGRWGTGPASVLALHGWRRTHEDFAPVFGSEPPDGAPGALGALAPDLPGFGATPPPPEAWGSEEYAAAVRPLFDEDLAERVVVVGHSFGGRVALYLQRMVPDRIERLVLTGVPLLDRQGRRRAAAAFLAARRLHALGLIGDRRMEALRNRYGSADYRAASGVMRGVLVRLLSEQYGALLPTIDCPVDLLWGSEDDQVPVEVATRARDSFPDATLDVLSGVGHLTPVEAPDALRRAVSGPAVSRRRQTPLPTGRPGADGGRPDDLR